MSSETLATELIKEQRASSKRWFIIAIISICALLLSNIAWIIYISIPTEVSSIEQAVTASDNNKLVGGDFYGGETENSQD